jgi:hypothetical protein
MTPDEITNELSRAFDSEDRSTFDITLEKVKGSFPSIISIPPNWKINTGKDLDPSYGTPKGVPRDRSVAIITRSFSYQVDPARYFRWTLDGGSEDILAYCDYT